MFKGKEVISLAEAKKLYTEDEIMMGMEGWAFAYPENFVGCIVGDNNQVIKWIEN